MPASHDMGWADGAVVRPMSPVAVLLHAFPLDHRMWAAQEQALEAAGWEVLVPDLPGFGGTELLDGEPSLAIVADALRQRLLIEGIDRVLLAGLSLGGYVAMAMLRQQPEICAGVILCDTKASADGAQGRANRQRIAEAAEADPSSVGRLLRMAVLPGVLGATTHASRPQVVWEVASWMDQVPAATVAWYQRAMAERPDSHDVLASIDVPALVLWGEEDELSPAPEQASMLEALRRGEEAVIPMAGHLSAVEEPAAVSQAMVRFAEALRPPYA